MLLECLEGTTQTSLQEQGLWRSTCHRARLHNGRKVREQSFWREVLLESERGGECACSEKVPHDWVVTEGVKCLYLEGGSQTPHFRLLGPVQSLLKLSLLY